jgi:hypothetical protein
MTMTLSGDGSITGLAAGGLPNGTVTADDLAAGAARANFGAGAVLQVVQATTTTTTSSSTTGTWIDIAGYSVTITPSSSTSKILLLGSCSLIADADSDGQTGSGFFRGLRNGSAIFTTTNSIFSRGGQQHFTSVDVKYLDSPSSTSALTYTFEFNIATTNRTVIANVIDLATIIAMEIAG